MISRIPTTNTGNDDSSVMGKHAENYKYQANKLLLAI